MKTSQKYIIEKLNLRRFAMQHSKNNNKNAKKITRKQKMKINQQVCKTENNKIVLQYA